MTDLQKFFYWLQFYRPGIKLLSWQQRALAQIMRQSPAAGRSFFIKLLADFDAHLSATEKGARPDFPQTGAGERT